jgi:hypothetical protein
VQLCINEVVRELGRATASSYGQSAGMQLVAGSYIAGNAARGRAVAR